MTNKERLTKLFWPILKFFEDSGEATGYRQSHRLILVVVGSLFLFLSLVSLISALVSGQLGGILPILVFFAVGLVAVVVGGLGTDAAVAKIWGMK